ncbi:MAG: histidine kinase [Actinomycetota bacterium]|nr:histidine kinase [Actinomycetota bacterium]
MIERTQQARWARRLAWGAWGLTIAALAAAVPLVVLTRATPIPGQQISRVSFLVFPTLFALAFSTVGAIVASKRPRHPVAWIFLVTGVAYGLSVPTKFYALYALYETPGVLPAGPVMAWISEWIWGPALMMVWSFGLLLFPDGRLPSRRWRPVAWLIGLAIPVASLEQMAPGWRLEIFPALDNPLVVEALARPVVQAVTNAAVLVAWSLAPLASLGSLLVRYWRAERDLRAQIKWFVYGAALAFAVMPAVNLAYRLVGYEPGDFDPVSLTLLLLAIGALPVFMAIAILKYRLFDIDVVISKTVLFAGLAAFITAIYVGIVVGLGSLVGAGGEPNLALSIVATAVVAVAFQPVRERLTRLANRLVYGRRATPYQVLSQFSAGLGQTVATEETLTQMARLLAEGTGAVRTQVWLNLDGRMHSAASWPTGAVPDLAPVVNPDGSLPAFAEVDRAVSVSYLGQLLGALTLTKPRGEPLTAAEDRLVEDLAGQAGLVLKNVRLTAELVARLEELRDSRRRLVAAQDQERRRLERDLHDGAQQQLIAFKLKLNVAKTLAERDGATSAAQLLDQLAADSDEAVQTLRELAHGIYPPLLAAEGLLVALQAHARKAPLPVTVEADPDLGRFPEEIEAAVYFCVLEAIQNAVKYAAATRVRVTLSHEGGELAFSVVDDGQGFDLATTARGQGLQNMTDRLSALDGILEIVTSPGQGTVITGQLYAPQPAPLSATR